jgi:hypothetical protein
VKVLLVAAGKLKRARQMQIPTGDRHGLWGGPKLQGQDLECQQAGRWKMVWRCCTFFESMGLVGYLMC